MNPTTPVLSPREMMEKIMEEFHKEFFLGSEEYTDNVSKFLRSAMDTLHKMGYNEGYETAKKEISRDDDSGRSTTG
jgi:UDP-N-acetyl-D-mannosaminuronic acid transferase (WecB/TagA/CpsF family)